MPVNRKSSGNDSSADRNPPGYPHPMEPPLHGPFLLNGPEDAPLTILLSHGAGPGMDHPFMVAIAQGLAACGWRVKRFEFPYKQRERATGRKRAPDSGPRLEACLRAAAATVPAGRLVLAGKSMGGRVSSTLADELGARALLCLGYPFHAPGRPAAPRIAHLEHIHTPTLILQGERDPFGTRAQVEAYPLGASVRLAWIPDGEHSFSPRKRSGHSLEANLALAVATCDTFLRGLPG